MPTVDHTDDADFSTDPSEAGDSDARPESVLCGAVVRADRVVDGLAFETCTVGGDDATDAIDSLYSSLGREDVRYLLVSGIAPAWFNLVDVNRLASDLDRPVLSVSFEDSEGLETALSTHFSGDALDRRLQIYRDAPPRTAVEVNDERVFVRAAGCDEAEAKQVVRAFTPTGGRPEPLRVARMAARAGRQFVGD
ncbi:hypothetical protein HFX_0408 [Haloferax mediterranei ATCC 33500]|uniref:UPF0215 protein HFX_0408 n=1 Tax=Haloferax mediterranei (strain ATCC 33500 / DSM 1411 / JCM 8866 / NBRC 14739 / NCIMB 2177 / R-4) TaxID=523841 RepID=I3R1N4_HALMT|nr:hypothetical protein HFX_0408 [Haloferax mediterranei ATCC 33500]